MKNISPLTYVSIDPKALRHNFKQIQRIASGNSFEIASRGVGQKRLSDPRHILAVVKADAYGHGVKKLAVLLQNLNVGFLGVSDVKEGIELRETGITKPILLLENSLSQYAKQICDHDLTPTVCTFELARALNRCAKASHKKLNIHIKVDTWMGRLGVWHEEAFNFIQQIRHLSHLNIKGIYTHFPVADTDKKFTQKQISCLEALVAKLDATGLVIPFIHAANSMGLAGYRTKMLNIFRPGLMLYGLYPQEHLKRGIRLKPVMSVRSRIIFLKKIAKGRGVNYGHTFVAKSPMTVATIPIGYSDGYFRAFSNKAQVLIAGRRCRVLGRVTMDQIVVDVTHVKSVRSGAPVTIMGNDGKEAISADRLAHWAGTISYEIVCSLGNNIPRIYK